MENELFDGALVQSSRVIYTPSPFARANLIHLQEAGRLQARSPHESRRTGLSSYLCFTVLSGAGELEYDGSSFDLFAGDCVFLDCRRPYLHRTGDRLWQLRWAHFNGPNMAAIYKKYQERGGKPCFTPRDSDAFAALLADLHKIAASEDYLRDMRLYEKLTALLTLLMEESWQPEAAPRPGGKKQNAQQVKEYLDAHFAEPVTLDALAERFYISKYYLTRVFREQFGISVGGYLTRLRITHAKQLLRFSDLPVEQIGRACGLRDANYFSRVFRKVEGAAPGEYRRRWAAGQGAGPGAPRSRPR